MLFMVVERFKEQGMLSAYKTFRESGRMLPDGQNASTELEQIGLTFSTASSSRRFDIVQDGPIGGTYLLFNGLTSPLSDYFG